MEISQLYEELHLYRLAAFYKWISTGRVFRLIERGEKHTSNVHLKCLLSRCGAQLVSLFDKMKIGEQKRRVDQLNEPCGFARGFPLAKKHLVGQLIQLCHLNSTHHDTIT